MRKLFGVRFVQIFPLFDLFLIFKSLLSLPLTDQGGQFFKWKSVVISGKKPSQFSGSVGGGVGLICLCTCSLPVYSACPLLSLYTTALATTSFWAITPFYRCVLCTAFSTSNLTIPSNLLIPIWMEWKSGSFVIPSHWPAWRDQVPTRFPCLLLVIVWPLPCFQQQAVHPSLHFVGCRTVHYSHIRPTSVGQLGSDWQLRRCHFIHFDPKWRVIVVFFSSWIDSLTGMMMLLNWFEGATPYFTLPWSDPSSLFYKWKPPHKLLLQLSCLVLAGLNIMIWPTRTHTLNLLHCILALLACLW